MATMVEAENIGSFITYQQAYLAREVGAGYVPLHYPPPPSHDALLSRPGAYNVLALSLSVHPEHCAVAPPGGRCLRWRRDGPPGALDYQREPELGVVHCG